MNEMYFSKIYVLFVYKWLKKKEGKAIFRICATM